jgi:DNA-binding winged helix-turn-helix (wHTH) protein/TolB-like protein
MTTYRFGGHEFDTESGELREGDRAVRLEPQPAKVLGALLERAGEVVAREELQRRVWPEGTFVDFDRGLAYCVAQIRAALGDSAETPRFVETLPKRGFRFLVVPEPEVAPAAAPAIAGPRRVRLELWAAVILLGAAALGFAIARKQLAPKPPTIAVALFDAEVPAADGALAARLTDAVTVRLAAEPSRWSVIGNAAILRAPRADRDLTRIGRELGADFVVLGQVETVAGRREVLAHWIRIRDQKHLWAQRFPADAGELERAVAEAVAAAVARELG